MRAAMYMPGLWPGSMSWTIYRAFRDALRDAGVELRIVTDRVPVDAADDDGPELLPLPDTPLHRALDRLAAPLTRNSSFLRTVGGMRRWLRGQRDLDLLYVEIAYPLGAAAALARRGAGWDGRLVVTPMGEDFLVVDEAAYGYCRYPLPSRLLRWTLREATGVRCISPLVERWIRDAGVGTGPRLLQPLNVAPATVAAATVDPADGPGALASVAALRRELGLGDGPLIGSLGRLHPFKGIHVLVGALEHLGDVELAVAGPSLEIRGYGDYRTHLEDLARRLGVDDRVRFVGEIDHSRVPDFLGAVDVLVVPSLLESLNRVCVEAAAAGTPFVVTSTTGISELLPDEPVGRVVSPDDPEALARGIREALGRGWAYDGAAARRWARRFAADEVAARLAPWLRGLEPGS